MIAIIFLIFLILIIFTAFKRKEKYPTPLVLVAGIGLLPIVLAPALLFLCPFLFDAPSSSEHITTWLLLALFLLYAPILAGIYRLSYWLYDRYKQVRIAIIPQLVVLLMLLLVCIFHFPIYEFLWDL